MKLFAQRLIVFFGVVLLLVLITGTLHRCFVYSDDSYLLAFRDKHERLASLPSPKLIIVGGSNNAFGWDSERIQKETGLNVVNLGYYAGQGIEYRLNEVSSYIQPGDRVLLSIEYQILHGHMSPTLPFLSVYTDARSIRYLSGRNVRQLLDRGLLVGTRGILRESIRALLGERPEFSHPYRRDSFNEFGDIAIRGESAQQRNEPFSGAIIEADWDALDRSIREINAFAAFCRSRDATVTLWLPSLPAGVFDDSRENLKETVDRLEADGDPTILNSLQSVKTDEALFFDSYYHLTTEGVRWRTDELIDKLMDSEQR